MKKRFLAIAIAAGLASPFAAQAEANVYGQIFMSVGTVDTGAGGTDNWQINSHSSRLGVKGSEDLGNGLSANYQLEYGVNPVAGSDTAINDTDAGLSQRNQWVGLKGNWGEVRVGRHDTPMKMSQGKFDQFPDGFGDIAPVGVTGISMFEDDRVAKTVAYLGKAGDVKYAIAIVPGEGDGTSTGGDGPADTISAAVIYESGPMYLALAMDSYDDTAGSASAIAGEEDMTRLTALYNMGKMEFGFLYETEGTSNDRDRDSMGLSFGMGMGSNKAKFQYISSTRENVGGAGVDEDTTSMSLGYDWGLSKATTLGVQYTDIEEETGAATTAEFTFMGVTMLHKF